MNAQVTPVSRVTAKLSVDDALLKEYLKENLNNIHYERSKFKPTEKTGNRAPSYMSVLIIILTWF